MSALLIAPLIVSTTAASASTPAGSLLSQAKAASPSSTVDEEEVFDEKLREFGYWSGAALGCVEEARRKNVEQQILAIYQRITQLFGTDRGFFYAAAFGRGTAIVIEPAKCPEFLARFEKEAAHTPVQRGSATPAR